MEARQDRPDWVAIKCDVKNAFNSASRACLLARLEGEPTFKHFASLFAVTTAASIDLVSGGEKWGKKTPYDCRDCFSMVGKEVNGVWEPGFMCV